VSEITHITSRVHWGSIPGDRIFLACACCGIQFCSLHAQLSTMSLAFQDSCLPRMWQHADITQNASRLQLGSLPGDAIFLACACSPFPSLLAGHCLFSHRLCLFRFEQEGARLFTSSENVASNVLQAINPQVLARCCFRMHSAWCSSHSHG